MSENKDKTWFVNTSGKGPVLYRTGGKGFIVVNVSQVIDNSQAIKEDKRVIEGVFAVRIQRKEESEDLRVYQKRVEPNIWEALVAQHEKGGSFTVGGNGPIAGTGN